MVGCWKFFTAVGDPHHSASKWNEDIRHRVKEEQLHAVTEHPEDVKHATPLTFREVLRRLFSTERFQVAVVCLVILDAFFVLIELLLDLSIIKPDHHHIAPQVFHYLSLALLTFFLVELCFKLYAYRCEFFIHKFEVFDGVVVIVSFIVDIVYISHEDAFDGVGLLILLRLWRVARIINGILLSVKTRAEIKVHKLEEENEHLNNQISELKEQKSTMEQEIHKLKALLSRHSIEY